MDKSANKLLTDKLIIKGARFLCSIGVSKSEREKKQEIIADIILFLDTQKAAKTDNIKYAVDYSKVHNLAKSIVEKNKCKLVEALAKNIAEEILNKFSAEKVLVRIKKPKALADANVKYTAVEIIRAREPKNRE